MTILISFLVSSAFAAQNVQFKTSDNQTLNAVFEPPKNNQPCVVMLHGLASAKEEWRPLIQELTKRGVGTFAYDARDYKTLGRPGPGSAWEKMVDDVAAAVRTLDSKHRISRDRIVLAGASLGANVALGYAALATTPPPVLALSPGVNYQGFQPEVSLPRLMKTKILFVASAADAASYQSCRQLQSRFPFIQLWTDVPPGHGAQMFDPGLLFRISEWIAPKN